MTETTMHMPPKRQLPAVDDDGAAQTGVLGYMLRPVPAEVVEMLHPEARIVPSMHAGPQRGVYRHLGKRLFDIAFVMLVAPIALLLIAISAALLWLEGGSPFYRQQRLGRGGDRFEIIKLRTMVRDADRMLARMLEQNPEMRREWDSTQKLKNDPRITRVGDFLRKTSLDELPQLWNVLRGEMSVVGPRPMLPDQLPLYGDPCHYFALRPGITGLWQVSNRNESEFTLRKTLDAEYDRCLSVLQDLRVLVLTVGAVVNRTGY